MNKYYLQAMLVTLLLSGCRSSILEDPTTTIGFRVEQASYVKLTIENSYNTVVATLVDGNLPAGYHHASWDAAGIPSGIYFYTLECKGTNTGYYFKQTKHMLMIR